jgi:hypothetical protein
MLLGRHIRWIPDQAAFLNDEQSLAEVRKNIAEGDIYIVRRACDLDLLRDMRQYLVTVGQSSLPNYERIEAGAPNFHRMNRSDPRAYVQGCFHQFVFFPWNQDVFDLFSVFRPVYHLKNRLSGIPAERFLGIEPQDGCTARLAFQFYPRGGGFLNRHADPVDYHQLTVPIMQLSKKGDDFETGGLYIQMADGSDLMLDDIAEWGDVVYFNAQCPHGVAPIDPGAPLRWHDYRGRWMLLFAVNRLAGNVSIGNAVDLERSVPAGG